MNHTPFKSKKHKRTKATDIPQSVKREVYERDGGRCVICGSEHGMPEAHFVPRSRGGLGIKENIVTICRVPCHYEFDHGYRSDELHEEVRQYLISKYPDWDESKLIYRRD